MSREDIKEALAKISIPTKVGFRHMDQAWPELEVFFKANPEQFTYADTLIMLTMKNQVGRDYWWNPYGNASITQQDVPMFYESNGSILVLRPATETETPFCYKKTLCATGTGAAYELAQLLLEWGLAVETWELGKLP